MMGQWDGGTPRPLQNKQVNNTFYKDLVILLFSVCLSIYNTTDPLWSQLYLNLPLGL